MSSDKTVLKFGYGLGRMVGSLCFAGFIAVKLAGTSLAAWSWWWLLFPPVPILGIIVQRVGL